MKEGSPEETTAETRKLAAIMFTDIVGFSRQMSSNEARMLRVLAIHNRIIQQAVTEHHGHVIKTIGDAFKENAPSPSIRTLLKASSLWGTLSYRPGSRGKPLA